jgi:tetratricopeptide (TPR) repeat protein
MLKEDPEDSFVLYAVAKEYEQLDDLEKALETYNKLKEADHDYVGLYYHLGKLYEILEEPDKALEAYAEGIDVAKSLADFHALSELNTAKTNLEIEM